MLNPVVEINCPSLVAAMLDAKQVGSLIVITKTVFSTKLLILKPAAQLSKVLS